MHSKFYLPTTKGVLSFFLIFFVSFLSFVDATLAKNFRNAYVSFDLPDNWDCHLEDTEWVCRSQDKASAREAIIILTAKEVGPVDSLAQYENYLEKSKTISSSKGTPVNSQVKHVKNNQINNHIWIDSLHLSSEVVGYYTRYLATVKGKIAILVTFSAHQRFYTKYAHQFFSAIQSLKVVATNSIFDRQEFAPLHSSNEQLGAGLVNAFPEDMYMDEEYEGEDEEEGTSKTKILLAFVILASALAYVYIKKKKA